MAARRAEQHAAGCELTDFAEARSRRLNPPEGHPDLVLIRAVGDGVLVASEAELIGDTRVEGEPLTAAARRVGVSYWACHKRHSGAERRLAHYLGHHSLATRREDPPQLPTAA